MNPMNKTQKIIYQTITTFVWLLMIGIGFLMHPALGVVCLLLGVFGVWKSGGVFRSDLNAMSDTMQCSVMTASTSTSWLSMKHDMPYVPMLFLLLTWVAWLYLQISYDKIQKINN